MNIGFDAKRYFHNPTGLGNYSRTLVNDLAVLYPQHQYLLFNPKPTQRFHLPGLPNMNEVLPQGLLEKRLSSLWRSKWVCKDFSRIGVDLFHGLSHELPVGINHSGVGSVVTVHDLIFERYPAQYGTFDVRMHRHKIRYACSVADRVIAISRQTADDLVAMYQVPPAKIDVCYQSCDPAFALVQPAERKALVKAAYELPDEFLLYVGSIIERKNLLGICKAIKAAGASFTLPLVVVGSGKGYKKQVMAYLETAGLQQRVFFLNDVAAVDAAAHLNDVANLAALYQLATALIYPSFFEGFGIPVLEAMSAGIPVITSNTSCMPETAGAAALYVDPASVVQMADALVLMEGDPLVRQGLVRQGKVQAERFSAAQCAASVMQVYEQISR